MKPENAPSGQEIPGSHAAHEHRPVSHSPTEEIRPNHYGAIGIQPAGESGRSGFHPVKFLKIIWHSNTKASRLCNVLWPVVPAAVTVTYSRTDLHLAIFVLNYLAMVPCANLIGFAGQELARKVHKVFGVIMETTLGSVVEIVLFMTLCQKGEYEVIKAAILGSVLATQLLCLGLCFFVGGIRHEELEFNEAVGEVGSDLLLTAGFGLIVPAAFHTAVSAKGHISKEELDQKVLVISRWTSILLIIAYAVYTYFQIMTHESVYDAIFEEDEERDEENQAYMQAQAKLTFTECIIALSIAIGLVSIIAISLVEEIPFIVKNRGVSDAFVGLILVPLVEKFAEHLGAIDEAWENQVNIALAHVLGATIQTSLFNGPLVVLVGWATGKEMDLNFDLFNIIVLILAILVVGNFLRDQKSNYLEGALCVVVYINIAVAAFYYPDPVESDGRRSVYMPQNVFS